MKQLLVFRHGKSDWSADYDSDHDRPLARRGRQAARTMGKFLRSIDEAPDLVVSSTALRARSSAELAIEAAGWGCRLELVEGLYDASPESVVALLNGLSDDPERLMLVGHQPTLSALVALLVAGGLMRFPTAALARVDCERESWSEVRAGDGTLRWLVTPKLLVRAGLEA